MSSHTRFQSFLGPDIKRFLAYKRSLRRRYDVEEKTLALLDTYLLENKIGKLAGVTPTVVDEFLLSRPRPRPRSYNHLRCTVGRLFTYLVDRGKLSRHHCDRHHVAPVMNARRSFSTRRQPSACSRLQRLFPAKVER